MNALLRICTILAQPLKRKAVANFASSNIDK